MSIILLDKEINGTPQQKADLFNDLLKKSMVQHYEIYKAGMDSKVDLHESNERDFEEMKNNPEEFNYNQK